MSARVVCDASALVALLLDNGAAGRWATNLLTGAGLAAPDIVGFEVANAIRRHELSGAIGADQSNQAHADLLDLTIELWPFAVVAGRAWELRSNLSSYDASYIAVAEFSGARLVTLDRRLARAPGIRCPIVVFDK